MREKRVRCRWKQDFSEWTCYLHSIHVYDCKKRDLFSVAQILFSLFVTSVAENNLKSKNFIVRFDFSQPVSKLTMNKRAINLNVLFVLFYFVLFLCFIIVLIGMQYHLNWITYYFYFQVSDNPRENNRFGCCCSLHIFILSFYNFLLSCLSII